LVKLIHTTQNISKGKKRVNNELLRLIERLDLDRPLMLREKLDIIWNKEDPEADNSNSIPALNERSVS